MVTNPTARSLFLALAGTLCVGPAPLAGAESFAGSRATMPDPAPQGDGGLTKVLETEGVAARVPRRPRAHRDRTPADVILDGGSDALGLASNLLEPAGGIVPGAAQLVQQGILLFDGKRTEVQPVRVRSLKDIEAFFTQNHRDVRKALGFDIDFQRTVPELHGFLERALALKLTESDLGEDDRKLVQIELKRAQKVDLRAMHAAAAAVIELAFAVAAETDTLAKLPTKKGREDVVGTVLFDRELSFGRFVIGGTGRNVYDCGQIAVIIDLGGDDEYRGPVAGAHEQRRYSVCIDVQGDDVYRAGNGALGSATYGLGVLVDLKGKDDYEGRMRCAGFGAGGIGLFVDVSGDDRAVLGAHSGGVGLFGIGQFLDLGGNDRQRGERSCFGVGLTGGLGQFVDVAGNDERQLVGGEGTASVGLGAARGLGPDLPGGFGVCLDLGGDDAYEAGDLALGVGDTGGLGVCIDAAGDDTYIAGCLSLGAARGGGIGILIDGAGKDHYFATESVAVALEGSGAFFLDRGGDDIYEVRGAGLGRALAEGAAYCQDLAGKNQFRLREGPLVFLGGQKRGFALFRSLGKDDTYAPDTLDPGPKGRRSESGKGLTLLLRR